MSNTPKIDEILDCIVSQEAITEGGWAEYTTDTEAIKYGNPLHNKDELKESIYQLILGVIEPDENEIDIPHRANAVSRNDLRQEQRLNLNNLFGKDK